jgi:hypothetical protein
MTIALRLLDMLDRTIAERQMRLAEAGVGSRMSTTLPATARLPAIVVAIDLSPSVGQPVLMVENTLGLLIRRARRGSASGGSMASKVALFWRAHHPAPVNPDRYLDPSRGAIDFGAARAQLCRGATADVPRRAGGLPMPRSRLMLLPERRNSARAASMNASAAQ